MPYPGRIRLAAINVLLLASGEYYALKGLVDADWSEEQFAIVVASMSTGLVPIVVCAIAAPPGSSRSNEKYSRLTRRCG
jgi:hypothetical protein